MEDLLKLANIDEALNNAQLDVTVGIKIVKLTGNDSLAFYAAAIEGYKKVGAHYHSHGTELYQILQGQGSIYIGPAKEGFASWQSPVPVKAGDCFTVEAGQAHQLVNTDGERLVIVFACPHSHLSTDRTMVNAALE